ncbi:MAG: preprotein translocase subunit YajC [Verrucomicrobiota bacterium]|nr:preprotein translocase subunit YajC [Limisphaera sp.]MDW8382270.1 preprotein translocase subunit YajC [Verrucomicrobiota bacterium]
MNASMVHTASLFAQAQPQGHQPPIWTSLVPIVLFVIIFYVLFIRPQRKREKEHAELLKKLKPGDEVVTSSGIIGRITSVKDDRVILRSEDTKLEVLKSSVVQIRQPSGS